MKSNWKDYLWSSLLITALLVIAGAACRLAHPWSHKVFGPYHMLTELVLALWVYGLASALLLRLLLRWRPMPTGEHSQDSPVFAYWKLLTVLYRLGQGAIGWSLPFFLRPMRDALFGARIGRDVASGGTIDDPYHVSVGSGSVLGNACLVTANYVNDGKLICQPVTIGEHVTIGANAIVMPGVMIGNGASIMSGAVVMPGTVVPAGERWRGNPARKWM